jgi:hypothetical protein
MSLAELEQRSRRINAFRHATLAVACGAHVPAMVTLIAPIVKISLVARRKVVGTTALVHWISHPPPGRTRLRLPSGLAQPSDAQAA